MMSDMAFRERQDGKWDSLSVESPPATLWERKGDIVVFRVPGHKQWVGRMTPPAYLPIRFVVLRIKSTEGKTIRCETLADFPATQQGRDSEARQWGS